MSDTVQATRENAAQEAAAADALEEALLADLEAEALAPAAVPEPTPVVGGLSSLLFGGRGRVAETLGESTREIVGEPGEAAPDYDGWKGAAKLADALIHLAFGRAAPEDCAVRMITGTVGSPIARRVLPECAELAARGVRVSLLLASEPRQSEDLASIAAISRAMGVPRLDDFVRIADFPGGKLCLEQAMIGDQFYWAGEPLARRRPTPLPAGATIDLTQAAAAPDAARLRFAAAWRLAGEPSHAFCRRVAAAARAL